MTEVPFSFVVRVHDIPAAGMDLTIVADERDRAEIAEALEIPDVAGLQADIRLETSDGNAVRLRGNLKGNVVQTCIVTLEPVEQQIEESLDVVFLPQESGGSDGGKVIQLDPLQDDDVEEYRNGRIELAGYLTEHLALGLDPYPRIPGTDFPAHIEDDTSDKVSPFESLKKLKEKKS